jgi:hypothetical protein
VGKWLVGIITAVITSVLIYWLTEGINTNVRQGLSSAPAQSSRASSRSTPREDDDDRDRPARRTPRRSVDDDWPARRSFPDYFSEARESLSVWCGTPAGRCQLFTPAPVGAFCTCFNNFTYVDVPGVVMR